MKHPARWMAAAFLILIGLSVLAGWSLGAHAFGMWLLPVAVVGALVMAVLTARAQGTRASVLTLAGTAGAVAFQVWVWFLSDWSWWPSVLATVVVVTPLSSIANASFRADIRRGQRRYEREARELLADVGATGTAPRPYSLYLRPFATTERLVSQPTESAAPGHEHLPTHLDLETVLARALRDRLPLVGLGRLGEISEGAARITTSDANWRSTMTRLATPADLIVMMPLAWESTQWELSWLVRNGLLGKVVMLMPETVGPVPSGVVYTRFDSGRVLQPSVQTWQPEQHAFDTGREWLAAVSAARTHGLRLPPLAAAGAIFTMDPATGEVAHIVPLNLSTAARRTRYLREAVAHLRAAGPSDADVGTLIARGTFYRGRTLDYALTRAADGYLLWSRPAIARSLLVRATAEGRSRPGFVDGYLSELPGLVRERLQMSDADAVAAYRAAVPELLKADELASRVPPDLVERLAAADEPPLADA